MTFITKENVMHHCRTCLKIIEIDVSYDTSQKKRFCINIDNNSKMQKLITSSINKRWASEVRKMEIEGYPQRLCVCCYNKLNFFYTFRKQIRKSAHKLHMLFYQGVNKVEFGDDADGDNQKIEIEAWAAATKEDGFEMLHNNNLQETESFIINSKSGGTKLSNTATDPDPFATIVSAKLEDTLSETDNEGSVDEAWQCFYQTESEDDSNKSIELMVSKDKRTEDKLVPRERDNGARKEPATQIAVTKLERDNEIVRPEIVLNINNRLNGDDQAENTLKRRHKGTKNSFKCQQCGHSFAHKITHDAHIRKVHEGSKRPFQCDRCDKAYSFIGGLYTHIKEIHEAEVRSYACNLPGCDRIYTSFIAMQKHKRLKHSDTPCAKKYVCEKCGAIFNQSGNLKYHRRSKHPTEEEQAEQDHLKERFECDVCKKHFHSRYTLKYHTLQLHTNEMKYECNVCGRRMAKKFMLVQHMLVHSTDKTQCEHCDRKFIRKFELEAHVKAVHMKLKPFECQYCSECFASRKTLRHHEYIHTGEKPYVCDMCGQAYRQQTCLKNHRKSHEKGNALTSNINQMLENSFSKNSPYLKLIPLTNGISDLTCFNNSVAERTNMSLALATGVVTNENM